MDTAVKGCDEAKPNGGHVLDSQRGAEARVSVLSKFTASCRSAWRMGLLGVRELPEDFPEYHRQTLSPYRGSRGPVTATDKYSSLAECARLILEKHTSTFDDNAR